MFDTVMWILFAFTAYNDVYHAYVCECDMY